MAQPSDIHNDAVSYPLSRINASQSRFRTRQEAVPLIEIWRKRYNTVRLHSSLTVRLHSSLGYLGVDPIRWTPNERQIRCLDLHPELNGI